MSIEGQGHFLTLAQGRVHTKIQTGFSQKLLLPNLLYAELLSIFDCLTNFPSLPVRSGFDELFPVTTFLTVSQSHDTLASMFLYIT